MQPDQKVGLALGVLLIGAVGAFFFRNEPEPSQRIPTLESAQEVNREIAEKRLTPYFEKIETDEPPRGTRTRPASDSRDVSDARTGERKLPRWEELQTERDDPFAEESSQGKNVPTPAPDPIRFEAAATASSAGPKPEHNQAWNPIDEGYVDSALPKRAPTEIIHEVQRGDTLSSIAGKYLGNQARFHEIFEANPDQLRDANDLQVGMKLRIPDAKAKPAAANSSPPKRAKKVDERKPQIPAQPDIAATDEVHVFASTSDESAAEEIIEEKPAEPKPPVPPATKFTPAKRRAGRAVTPVKSEP